MQFFYKLVGKQIEFSRNQNYSTITEKKLSFRLLYTDSVIDECVFGNASLFVPVSSSPIGVVGSFNQGYIRKYSYGSGVLVFKSISVMPITTIKVFSLLHKQQQIEKKIKNTTS